MNKITENISLYIRSRHSVGLRAERARGRSSSSGKVKNFLLHVVQDRVWGPFNLLPNCYGGLFLREQSDRSVKLTTHLQLVQRSRRYGSIHPLPQYTFMAWCPCVYITLIQPRNDIVRVGISCRCK
jgi:hypothetical protein